MIRRAPSVGAGYGWWGGGEAGSSCTESLGSETGDVGCDDAEIDQLFFPPPAPPAAAGAGGPEDGEGGAYADDARALGGVDVDVAAAEKDKEGRPRGGSCRCRFPPAMPRATGALFLRAERRAGRLILTEVRADEHERRVVFRARRDGGRLRLRFANDDDDDADVAPDDFGGGSRHDAGAGGGGSAGVGGAGGPVVPVAVQVQHGGAGGGGELCQVAAGVAAGRRGGVEVVGAAVMMGTI